MRRRCRATSFAASRSPAARSGVSGPSIAAHTEPRTSSPARTPIAIRWVVMPSASRMTGSTIDRTVIAVQVAEDASLGQDAGVPLGHLPPDDRLGARRVGLLLAAREREHPRRAVLDRDRCVQQRGDRVGDREEVAGGQAADRLALRLADVAVGEERSQERGELRPRRTPCETEQRDSGCLDRGAGLVVDLDGGSHHECDRSFGRQRLDEGSDAVGVHAHAEDERARRVRRLVERVVDDDPAHVHERIHIAVDEFEQGMTEVVEDAAQARTGPLSHAREPNAQIVTRSTHVVSDSRIAMSGSTPRPGPVGTSRWPSRMTKGAVMSVR